MARGMSRLALCLASLLLVGWANAANLEGACSAEDKCEIIGAECTTEKCMCLADYTPNTEKTECVQAALGGVCLDTTQCKVDLTVCIGADGSKSCTCEDKVAVPDAENKKCLLVAASIDGACEVDAQCSTPFPDSKCDGAKCKCKDTHVENSLKNKCLKKLNDFVTVCEESQQCGILNSECSGETGAKKCKCSSEYIPNSANNACLKSAEIIGDSCSADPKQCESIVGSTCDANKKCTCNTDFIASVDNKRCLEVRDTLNEVCEQTQQCKIENSECTDAKCKCSDKYVAGVEAKSCLEKRNITESCFQPQQCTDLTLGNVDCIGGFCKCKPENHFVDTQCWKDIKLDQECSVEEECILSDGDMKDVECVMKKCKCIVYTVPDVGNNKCNSGVTNTVAVISMAIFIAAAKLF